MKLTLEQLQEKAICQAVTGLIGREPYREPIFCGKQAAHECTDCGLGVCTRCTLPCYECGEHLHDDCRDEHKRRSGHDVDHDRLNFHNLDVFIDRILLTGERFQ